MNLEEIIIKSRRLVDKLRRNEEAHLTKEDYFMICVSLFVAKKESVMKKNNKTSTLYFDYKEHRKEYELMDKTEINEEALDEIDIESEFSFEGCWIDTGYFYIDTTLCDEIIIYVNI